MRRVDAIILVFLISGSLGSTLTFPVKKVTAMDIGDLDNDKVYDYVLGCHKVVSDPWDRGALYVYENNQLKWYYHLPSLIKALTIYDLDSDNRGEIIAACDIVPDRGYVYVFEDNGKMKWRTWVHGSPQSLFCYGNYVAVNLYGQGNRVMIFDDRGEKVGDLPVSGRISKFEIRDLDDDGKHEFIVSEVIGEKWEHFLIVYDLKGNVLWNYETWERINDFEFCDIEGDRILECVIGTYDTLHITSGGHLIRKVRVPPPILHVKIIEDKVLVATYNYMALFSLSDLLTYSQTEVYDYRDIVSGVLFVEKKPEFLFLKDVDADGENEVVSGDGETLTVAELSEFAVVIKEVVTVPAEEAKEREIVITVCEAQFLLPEGGTLNDEWVKLCNEGDSDIDMTGWVVMNSNGIFYEFPDVFVLKAGASVVIHTGAGEDTETDLYWGSSAEVWNNGGDTVVVQDDKGATVVEYKWSPA